MVFSSVEFIFLYFPAVLLLYFLLPRKVKNIFLLVVSILFYFWGEDAFAVIMMFSTIINYMMGLFVSKNKIRLSNRSALLNYAVIHLFLLLIAFFVRVIDTQFGYKLGAGVYLILAALSVAVHVLLGLMLLSRRVILSPRTAIIIAIVLNLGLLGFFKYTNFILDNLNSILALLDMKIPFTLESITRVLGFPVGKDIDPHFRDRVLPAGISFFTFHCLSYLIDVYRDEVPAQRSFTNIALYISFFPQLIAGPIIRYHDVASQLLERRVTREKFALGLKRVIIGLGKKVLVADTLAFTTNEIFKLNPDDFTAPLVWCGLLCYAIHLYFDFSGYSDMAIGMAHMFGFTFLENFRYPFISLSIRDHWTRWHISLTNWFRDYVYIPLGGNRGSEARTYFNLVIIFVLCGFWHGAEWHYLFWGLFNGLFLALERKGIINVEKFRFTFVKWFYATFVILIGYVFFRSPSMPVAMKYLAAMFGLGNGSGGWQLLAFYVRSDTIVALACGIIGSAPTLPYLDQIITTYLNRTESRAGSFLNAVYPTAKAFLLVLVLVLALVKISSGTFSAFIYYQF